MNDRRDYRLAIGFLAGAAAGVGLMMWLAPRSASEARQRVTESATKLGQRASARVRQAGDRVGDAVDDLTQRGYGVRDDVAGAVERGAHEVARSARGVARGAHEVETFAAAVQGNRG
jgi:gas vesicle protein